MIPVRQFIELHRDEKYYCEAIIDPWGRIDDACPSHQEYLINQYCLKHSITRDALFDGWDPAASPLHWLVEDLNYGAVWYSFVILPLRFTNRQIATLRSLIGSMSVDLKQVDVSIEKSLIRLRNKKDLNGLEKLSRHKSERIKEAELKIWRKTEHWNC